MKGIILAAGLGTRLYLVTKAISKQMVPIYDKPMVYYPMSVLMLAEITDILIISTPRDIVNFKQLFNDGRELGLNIEYAVQKNPNGIAEAFIIGEEFIGNDNVAMILEDNIFYGQSFLENLKEATNLESGAYIFGYYVENSKSFGVVEFDINGNAISLEEKPEKPKSKYIAPGLYFYDNSVVEKAKALKLSKRGELEITNLNKVYLAEKKLKVQVLGRGIAWIDTGTHASMLQASKFVEAVQNNQGAYIACLEEIAYRKNWITSEQVIELAEALMKNGYGKYLMGILEENKL